MLERYVILLVGIIAGAIGANFTGKIGGQNIDLGSVPLNSFVGAVGGIVGCQIVMGLIPHQGISFESTTEQVAAGLVAGAIAIINSGLFNSKMSK
jgi:CDP-diglyceride synthetase